MPLIIEDRRKIVKGKSTGNNERFLRRIKHAVQQNAHNLVNGNVGSTSSSGQVTVDRGTIDEPSYVYSRGGYYKVVMPGNKEFVRGDVIDLEGEGSGNGSKAGRGQGQDDFVVNVSRDEFLDYFFEDLELPNLQERDDTELVAEKNQRAGYTNDGSPSNLSIIESKKKAKSRKLALTSASRKKLKEAQLELISVELELSGELTEEMRALYTAKRDELNKKIEGLKQKIKRIPGFEEMDLRYRNSVKVMIRKTSAVLFFIMDNSGSMGADEKRIARKFFTLLYLFVTRKYEDIDMVFISHTEVAREVTEEEFFNTRESGGTVVSTALQVASKILHERYDPNRTNVYFSQASDGDNITSDSALCFKELGESIIPFIQHYSYVQVGRHGFTNNTSLWETFQMVAKHISYFSAEKIPSDDMIYSVFSEIFKKEGANV